MTNSFSKNRNRALSLLLLAHPSAAGLLAQLPAKPPRRATLRCGSGYSAWPGWFPWKVSEGKGLYRGRPAFRSPCSGFRWHTSIRSTRSTPPARLHRPDHWRTRFSSWLLVGAEPAVVVLTNDNSTGNDQVIRREGSAAWPISKGKSVEGRGGTVDITLLCWLRVLKQAGLTPMTSPFVPLETGAAAAPLWHAHGGCGGRVCPLHHPGPQAQRQATTLVLFRGFSPERSAITWVLPDRIRGRKPRATAERV